MASRIFMSRWIACLLILAIAPAVAQAGMITFTNSTASVGGGMGNLLTGLVVQSRGQESGSVLWDGTQDVRTGNAKNQSSTRTSGELLVGGVAPERFYLIFNVSEPGNDTSVLLSDFSLRFMDSSGAALFPDLVFDAPDGGLLLNQTDGGVSGGGWVFRILLTPSEATSFFSTTTNRLGMIIAQDQAIQMTGGAPEVFFFSAVPEPASAVLLAVGVAMLGFAAWRRRAARA